jgi:hypothetical protein
MARHERGGYGLSATTPRAHRTEETVSADGSFAALIAEPAKGSFVMPARARLYVYAPQGHFGERPSARITMPDGSSDVLITRRMDPGERTVLGQTHFERGTVVTPAAGLLVQIRLGSEWMTIARC